MKKPAGPAHYSAISLNNFRGFRNLHEMPLAPLTFLVGPNSAGKSSLFDALLLIAQSDFAPFNIGMKRPAWAGPMVDLGSFRDAVYKHRSTLPMAIGVVVKNVRIPYGSHKVFPDVKVTFTLRTSPSDPIGILTDNSLADLRSNIAISLSTALRPPHGQKFRMPGSEVSLAAPSTGDAHTRGRLDEDRAVHTIIRSLEKRRRTSREYGSKAALRRLLVSTEDFPFRYFNSQMERVASGRGGPKRWYPVQITKQPERRYAFDFVPALLDRVDPELLAPKEYFGPRSKRGSRKRRQMADVLKELDIAKEVSESSLSPYHLSIEVTDSKTNIISNLIDVGYGTSQVIPVIYGCLSPASGPLLVEQPEIHLHPKAQGIVAALLCTTSQHRQVIVETHSEHLINRARIMIADGDLDPRSVIINYVWRDKAGSHVKTIGLDKSGDFTAEWPAGFFDERFQDTMRLAELRRNAGGK